MPWGGPIPHAVAPRAISSEASRRARRAYGQLLVELAQVVPDGIVCFFVSYLYMDQIISAWHALGVLEALMAHKLVFIETQVRAARIQPGRLLAARLTGSADIILDKRCRRLRHCQSLSALRTAALLPLLGCHRPQATIRSRQLRNEPPAVEHAQDVVETTLALDNFRRACDCGRGAVFLSVARGKVAEGIDFDRHYGRCALAV